MEWIGRTFTSDAGWRHAERLVDVEDRMAGGDGEREAAAATRDALAAFARDARLSEFPVTGWTRGDTRLDAGGEAVAGSGDQCVALPRSPAGRAEGRLVDLGSGLPRDFEATDLDGAVVMVSTGEPDWFDRPVHRREKYGRAVDAGAAAFVYRHDRAGCLPPTGSVGTAESPVGAVPAVGVSRELGERLARRHDGEPVAVTVEAETGEATSRNVHAELGPDTERVVLLTSHVDAHDEGEGAVDNAAGTATLVEVAKALSAREDDLETRVRFTAFGAEEVGLVGSRWQAERDDADAIRAVVNVDGVCADRDLAVTTNGFDGFEAAVSSVADRFDHPVDATPAVGAHSDHWPYVVRGIPGCHVHSGGADRGWGHTRADTLDKLDSRTLRECAVLLTELVVELSRADRDLPRVTPDEIAARCERRGLEEGMRAAGDWPFES